jgi:alpha-1,6-mannosyltransferase
LFDAFKRLPRERFVLVLAGDGPEVANVRHRAEADPRVKYIGHLESRDELATAYASADVFVAPGRFETFGMSTLEAMCSGLPIVGIKSSGTASFVPPNVGVMAPAGDAASVAMAILDLAARNRTLTSEICHRIASSRYSWDRVFDRYFAAYAELIGTSAAPMAEATT